MHTIFTEHNIGVNTGYGGSADLRTSKLEDLQRALIRELHYGIISLPTEKALQFRPGHDTFPYSANGEILKLALPNEDPQSATCMPESWVRATIAIRANSLASGHSGVRPILLETMAKLLSKSIVPVVPLHGSISASGDLSPLSYLAGALQGKPTLRVWAEHRITTADRALANADIEPLRLGAKEGLAIVNGTAVSCAGGSLAMHDAHCLAVLSQITTAMSVEALCGTDESFDPFFAAVRPHPGQIEFASNVLYFLKQSKLVAHNDGSEGSLRQDRYSIRTSSQWIGPVLEDFLLAHKQLLVECNSVTDNPLIDSQDRSLHGGNFQAKAVTSAMEKVRPGLQSIGRMVFTQTTELINPATNRGLPPNLVADEPSLSFFGKGTDLMIAALVSELGFLSNPVGTHVQTAEMGNQALNSLALISARYTHTSCDVLSKLMAAQLFSLCQALDLRALHRTFLSSLEPHFHTLATETFETSVSSADLVTLQRSLWTQLLKSLDLTSSMDSEDRFITVAKTLQVTVLEIAAPSQGVGLITKWSDRCASLMLEIFVTSLEAYSMNPDPFPFIGRGSQVMYRYVREQLGVPFLRSKMLIDAEEKNQGIAYGTAENDGAIGTLLTKIYTAIRSGAAFEPAMGLLAEAKTELEEHQRVHTAKL